MSSKSSGFRLFGVRRAVVAYFALCLLTPDYAVLSFVLSLRTGPALALCDSPRSPALAGRSAVSPILDAINQNTPGLSEGYPVGVPATYAWHAGSFKPPGSNVPPSDFTAVTGWAAVYPKVGSPAYSDPEGSILIANAKTYVHVKTVGEWALVQDQTADGISGGHFVSDFKGNAAIPMRLSVQPDGVVSIGTPPAKYNDHVWITKRGEYPAASVDGVYVQMEMKTTDPKMKLVANIGADWWRDETADFVDGFVNNPGAGMSNWKELSPEWTTLRFYSWSTMRLLKDPPPPLAEAEPAANAPGLGRSRP